ncbi:hypothetical protein TNIN_329181 [Trichonephila inaurata madagascariensis]|uniref:Uncharacterized protein n=1 Tax=Trichonephila inaurata madagascariensis TaxID=2747483 RepID=A0A8X6WQW3_9ARAC|nr:hypothetical protein TNIN_329181 [Trichonephila inaurata madagascariensis]
MFRKLKWTLMRNCLRPFMWSVLFTWIKVPLSKGMLKESMNLERVDEVTSQFILQQDKATGTNLVSKEAPSFVAHHRFSARSSKSINLVTLLQTKIQK